METIIINETDKNIINDYLYYRNLYIDYIQEICIDNDIDIHNINLFQWKYILRNINERYIENNTNLLKDNKYIYRYDYNKISVFYEKIYKYLCDKYNIIYTIHHFCILSGIEQKVLLEIFSTENNGMIQKLRRDGETSLQDLGITKNNIFIMFMLKCLYGYKEGDNKTSELETISNRLESLPTLDMLPDNNHINCIETTNN